MLASVVHDVIPMQVPRAEAGEDLRLIAQCAQGDTSAFETIYGRYGERLKRIAWNQLGNIADAEDAVQETFLKIHRSAASFTAEASLFTWICRILINTCVDLRRRRMRRIEEAPLEYEDEPVQYQASTVDDAKRISLRKLLDELPAQRRTVFTLFEIEGMSHAEIAAIVGITEATSKWTLFMTRKELKDRWKTNR
jgi:RNA polymerase sigma-70 factor (ECF subfamily)